MDYNIYIKVRMFDFVNLNLEHIIKNVYYICFYYLLQILFFKQIFI